MPQAMMREKFSNRETPIILGLTVFLLLAFIKKALYRNQVYTT